MKFEQENLKEYNNRKTYVYMKNNTIMDHKVIGMKSVDWILVAQNGYH
jgi:hypothetical protein